MKKIISTIGITALLVAGFSSCQKVLDDIQPSGSTLSLEQLKKGAEASPDRAAAGLPGMYAALTARSSIINAQSDFGFPSFVCRLEHAGDNLVSTTHGYNWFNSELRLSSFNAKKSNPTIWIWNFSYKNIKLANDLLAPLKETKNPELLPILGQAYAQRAWNYFNLARVYQHTYAGNEDKLCVPLVTEETSKESLANNPRKKVKEVYDFILSDLEKALAALKGFKPAEKNKISEAVAYGLRSRVWMTMNKWKEAAADAQKAIELSGAKPYSIADCSIPNFDDVQTASNAMWGIIITAEDAVTKSGIANWTSMFTSLCFGASAYTTSVGTYKAINTRLFKQIPETDVRRGWWLYDKKEIQVEGKAIDYYTSPVLDKAYPGLAEKNALGKKGAKFIPYTVVKFAPNNKSIDDEINAVDFMLMRVEEMYYNLAESKAMGGDFAGGKKVLEDFVKTYRNPGFISVANDAKGLQDEIYFQKRIEFWGEGISWFDMLRMNKGIDRIDVANRDTGGYPERTRFNVKAGDALFVLQIPESEEQANKAIAGNNNELCKDPVDQL